MISNHILLHLHQILLRIFIKFVIIRVDNQEEELVKQIHVVLT